MSEQQSTPIQAEKSPGGEQCPTAQSIVPLERWSVQATIVFLVVVCLAVILWAGRATLWPSDPPRTLIRPAVLVQIDINRADDREFALLPGVGPVLAKRIVANRTEQGHFVSIQDLSRVHGIGEKTIARITMYCLPVGGDDTRVALAND